MLISFNIRVNKVKDPIVDLMKVMLFYDRLKSLNSKEYIFSNNST